MISIGGQFGLIQRIRMFLRDWNPLSYCVGLYVFAILADFASTEFVKHNTIGLNEGNPFARGADLQFLLWKGCVDSGLFLLALVLLAIGLYFLAATYSRKAGKILAAIPFLYFAWDRISDAVLFNILYGLHMYEPGHAAQSVLQKILGGQ